jgi:hypothetical protein
MTEEMDDNEAEERLKLAKDIIRKRIEAIQRKRLRHESSTMPVGRPRKRSVDKNLDVSKETSPPLLSEESGLNIMSTKISDTTVRTVFEITDNPTTTIPPLRNESSSATSLIQHASTPIPNPLIADNQTTDILPHKLPTLSSPKSTENNSFNEMLHPTSTAVTSEAHQSISPQPQNRQIIPENTKANYHPVTSDNAEGHGINPNVLIYSRGR